MAPVYVAGPNPVTHGKPGVDYKVYAVGEEIPLEGETRERALERGIVVEGDGKAAKPATKKELVARAKELGIDVPAKATAEDIQKLIDEHDAGGDPLEGETVEGAQGNPVVVPEGVVLGETPGWPVDADGKPLELTDEQRDELAKTALENS